MAMPGNVRQARALAAAMGLGDARDILLRPRAPWRWVAPRTWPATEHAFGPDFTRALDKPPRVAIGCGRQAALATRLLRVRGARVVQILDPRLPPESWDVVVAPEHDGLAGPNVVTLVGSLHAVDDLWLAQARNDFSILAPLAAPRTTVLLGGPTSHAGYDTAALAHDLQRLAARVREEGGSLLATTSRRTPATGPRRSSRPAATCPACAGSRRPRRAATTATIPTPACSRGRIASCARPIR
jgi:mitochondrial fission protein ELM1